MTQSNKLTMYKQHMAARGVGEAIAFPPAWHILWSLGLQIPPPPFLRFFSLALTAGGLFGTLFGLATWLLGNRGFREMPAAEAMWIALISGAIFGLVMATYYRHLARKHKLGTWASFPVSGLRS